MMRRYNSWHPKKWANKMGWFKKLKKKISLKNFVKGAKKLSKYVPGGDLIRQGIEIAEGAYKEFFKKPQAGGIAPPPITPRVTPTTPVRPAVAGGGLFGGGNMMPLLIGGAVVLFLLMRK